MQALSALPTRHILSESQRQLVGHVQRYPAFAVALRSGKDFHLDGVATLADMWSPPSAPFELTCRAILSHCPAIRRRLQAPPWDRPCNQCHRPLSLGGISYMRAYVIAAIAAASLSLFTSNAGADV